VAYCLQHQRLFSIHGSAVCFWEPFECTGEHKALAWVRYKIWRWGGAIMSYVKCITSSFLTFFQFGENISWNTEGFTLGMMCSRRVYLYYSCTKAPWVYRKSDLHRNSVRRDFQIQRRSFGVALCWNSPDYWCLKGLLQMLSGCKQNISIHYCFGMVLPRIHDILLCRGFRH